MTKTVQLSYEDITLLLSATATRVISNNRLLETWKSQAETDNAEDNATTADLIQIYTKEVEALTELSTRLKAVFHG